ncbi:MAG: hypothetical protein WB424_19105 [Terracidiphilus sp.]
MEDLKLIDLELYAHGLNVAAQFGDVDECPSASGKWAPVWESLEWISAPKWKALEIFPKFFPQKPQSCVFCD